MKARPAADSVQSVAGRDIRLTGYSYAPMPLSCTIPR